LRPLRETSPGKTPGLNAGLAAAEGDLLALIDDDVVVAADWVTTLRRLFRDPDLALVGGRVEPRWERPAPEWLSLERQGRYTRMASPLALQHYGDRQPLGPRTAVGANLAVRRDVLRTVGAFAPHLGRLRGTLMCGEDHEFCERVRTAGYHAAYDPSLVVRHWVPAERARLGYFLRWFFWSGVTNATIDAAEPPRGAQILGSPRYVWGRLSRATATAVGRLLLGRRGDATSAAMDAVFAAGYIWTRLRAEGGRQEISARRQQAPQLPARTQSPAIPIPGNKAGKPIEAVVPVQPQQQPGQKTTPPLPPNLPANRPIGAEGSGDGFVHGR
jgi:cellulose synthase/poly-beta-1,6-N-acetylglucosamine synthase-like glycosyltransferase